MHFFKIFTFLIFCPLSFLKMWGCSHWLLNQNLNSLYLGEPQTTCLFIKFEKSAKSTLPIVQYTVYSLASDCCCDTKVFFFR